ncbi:MAG: T9SS type A sorting domain-containing protein [Bacteroidales bacterium]
MKKITLFVFYLILIVNQSFSQIQIPVCDTLSTNNIKTLIWTIGKQFTNFVGPYYQYPNGSGKNTIFSSSMWYGAKDNLGQLHFAGERYNTTGYDFWTGPLKTNGTASTDSITASSWNKLWKINKQDLLNYLNSTAYPSNPPLFVLNWPAHGDTSLQQSYQLAPFVDINNNGKYEPYLGDYPKIYGDQCIFFILNDSKTHYESHGVPIGLEIHVFAYAFNNPSDSALHNSIFYKYKIINRSSNTYNDFYLGLFTDLDIGYAFDDYVACDVERATYYAYNGWSADPIYGSYPPAQGVTILAGPKMDADGIDNASGGCDYSVNGINFGDNIIDNERLGMCRFLYYNNSNNPTNGEPRTDTNYYDYLRGYWKNGQALSWGADGVNTTSGSTARFMFPGLSDSLNWGTGCGVRPTPNDWSEVDLQNAPGDRRGLASMGPFTFIAGATQYADIVYTTATAYNFKSSSVDVLKQRIDHIRDFYNNYPSIFQDYVGVIEKEPLMFNIYPNPASDYLVIEGKGFKKLSFTIFNIVGQSVIAGNLVNNSSKINIASLNSGIYFIKIYTESKTKTIKFIKR